jgi:nicotinamidase-related amidase
MFRFPRRYLAACALSAAAAGSAFADAQPTIRAMSGATPIDQLQRGKTALLVIDFQNEYFTGRMPIPDGDAALRNTRQLIDFADRHDMPVYHVQHVAPASSPVFALGGETVKFHPQMQPRAQDVVLQKTSVSAFGSTDLDARLKAKGIDTLVISGLMTHACVAGAARDAAPLGYKVVVASDASATRAIRRANGESIDKDSLHRAALAEVEDTFGDVLTTAEILQLPVQ